MSSWMILAVIAMVIWGVVQVAKARAGIVTDEDGNETLAIRDETRLDGEVSEARREIEQLRDRIQVLERIATDTNTADARERARITAEIEALRVPDSRHVPPPPITPNPPSTRKSANQEELSK